MEIYRTIFEKECAKQGMVLSDEVFKAIVWRLKTEKSLELAAYQPKFIVDQVVATCRFMKVPPHFEPRFIDYALNNLRVKRNSPAAVSSAPIHSGIAPRPDDSLSVHVN